MEEIVIAREIIASYPDTFELVLTASDIECIFKSGKIASGVRFGKSLIRRFSSAEPVDRGGNTRAASDRAY